MMKRIVFFCATLGSGGAERVISVLSSEMLLYYSEVEIITFFSQKIFYKINSKVKVTQLEENTDSNRILANCKFLRQYLQQKQPTVLVSFMAPFNILALLSVPHKRDYPVIVADRNDPRFECRNFHRRLLRHFLYKYEADRVVVQTQNNKLLYPFSIQKKMDVICNPIFLEKSIISCALNVKKEKLIVNVARLDLQKNQKLLLRCFKKVITKYPDYKLIIYGEGPAREEISNYINYWGLHESVEMPGKVTNIIDKIKSAEVFVLSSDYEGMSNAMLEAMCIGLPVISTEVSGAVDLIRDGENGLLVPCGDEDKLTAALLSLLDDKEKAMRLAVNASKVAELLNVEAITQKWMDTIRHAITIKFKMK